jgi:predicted nuclease with TOPRIM domain
MKYDFYWINATSDQEKELIQQDIQFYEKEIQDLSIGLEKLAVDQQKFEESLKLVRFKVRELKTRNSLISKLLLLLDEIRFAVEERWIKNGFQPSKAQKNGSMKIVI